MKAYVAIGSNQGRRLFLLARAIYLIGRLEGVRIRRVSPLYQTEAVGGPRQADYLNGVLHLEITLSPSQLMAELLAIEQSLGRVRRLKWGPRVIDLDLLAIGNKIQNEKNLKLPHPRYHQRRFVLVPFCDLAPRFVHPLFGVQNRSLLRKLTPQGQKVTIVAQWKGTRFAPSKKRRKPRPPSSH